MTGDKRDLKRLGILLAAAAALVLLYHCPFRFFFGIACPGCGMTRALLAAIRFDFAAAFDYHPLWPFLLPTGMYIALRLQGMHIPDKRQNIYIAFLLVVMFAVYVMRFCAGDPVVRTDEAWAVWLRIAGRL